MEARCIRFTDDSNKNGHRRLRLPPVFPVDVA